jgi:hypothetical protein
MRHFTHAPMRVSSLVSRMSSIHSTTSCHLRRGKNHFHPLGDTIEYLFFGTGECEIGRSSIPPTAVAPILEYPPSSFFFLRKYTRRHLALLVCTVELWLKIKLMLRN